MIQTNQAFSDSEIKRLDALNSYNVLDSFPEKEYDAITRLASYICQVPIALITLIDEERQWFKSKVGLDINETARGDAFCNHTILSDELMEIENATEHEIFKHNPFVSGTANIRFYAGAPLIDPEGHRLGSLCVIDTVPHKLTPEQRDALRTLADEIMSHFVLRKQKLALENSLKVHKEFFNLFNSSPEIHLIADKDSNIELINNSVKTILGYEPREAIGRSLWDFVVGRNREQFVPLIEKALVSGQSYELETQTISADNKVKWIGWCGIYKAEKWYASGRDITYQKKILADLERLSLVASKIVNGIVISDADDKIIWTNGAFEKITGYNHADVENKRLPDVIIGPDDDKGGREQYNEQIQKKQSYSVHVFATRKDGRQIWLSINNSVIYNEQGESEKYIRVIVDITKRITAQKDLEMLSLVASNTTSGVVINNSEGEIEWVNHAFEKITGYNLTDVNNKHLGDILQGELTDQSIIQKGRDLSKNKQSFEVDLLAYRKDGKPIWLTVINSIILNKEGAVDKYIEVVIDISAKKKVELELIAAKEEALQLSRAKDMFISVMSHEIRTPLNAVIGISRLLLDANLPESQKENLDVLKFSADNLMTLINDVLDFTKIETGNVELEKGSVDLRETVQSIIGSLQYKTKPKNIYLNANIDAAVPAIVIGDSTRLSQILLNLGSNAVKFTEHGGITIELKVIEQTRKNVRIRFSVTDTGIGIAHSKLSTIFESFKQAEVDITRKYGGTGLGLAISKKLIELHDSRINVDSEPGKGSTFWFTITFNKDNNKKSNQNKVEREINMHVLVVDDNQINRLLINKILTKWGATIDFAENGLQAVNKVESNKNYDAVLMDIHMPEMGGLEATQIIRAKSEPYFKQLPIIALTASMLNAQISLMGDAGMNDYILKPFEPGTLFEKLSRYQKQ